MRVGFDDEGTGNTGPVDYHYEAPEKFWAEAVQELEDLSPNFSCVAQPAHDFLEQSATTPIHPLFDTTHALANSLNECSWEHTCDWAQVIASLTATCEVATHLSRDYPEVAPIIELFIQKLAEAMLWRGDFDFVTLAGRLDQACLSSPRNTEKVAGHIIERHPTTSEAGPITLYRVEQTLMGIYAIGETAKFHALQVCDKADRKDPLYANCESDMMTRRISIPLWLMRYEGPLLGHQPQGTWEDVSKANCFATVFHTQAEQDILCSAPGAHLAQEGWRFLDLPQEPAQQGDLLIYFRYLPSVPLVHDFVTRPMLPAGMLPDGIIVEIASLIGSTLSRENHTFPELPQLNIVHAALVSEVDEHGVPTEALHKWGQGPMSIGNPFAIPLAYGEVFGVVRRTPGSKEQILHTPDRFAD